jgi:hypothetical protein
MASYWCCASCHEVDDTGYHRRYQAMAQNDFAPPDRFPPLVVIQPLSFNERGVRMRSALAGSGQGSALFVTA